MLKKGLGNEIGFIAGVAQIIEFVFAPPAIAAAIGAYMNIFFPTFSITGIAIFFYFIFTALNISGVKSAAIFELAITIFAVIELLIFAGATLPSFDFANLQKNSFPHGIKGVFAAIPFAIWFFLGIEGLANVAEEVIHPQKNIMKGFGSAIITLVILCLLTFFAAVGVNGWETIVYSENGKVSDSPLPLALSVVSSNNEFLYHLLVTVGLFGLVASFHGIILAGGRATFEFGRVGYAPKFLGSINQRFKTPANALLINMIIGIIALLSGKTSEIITIACFGALTLYIISLYSLFALRKKYPKMVRPFKVPMYPYFPLISIVIALVSILSMTYFNQALSLVYIIMMGLAYLTFWLKLRSSLKD